jgi:hypothetical protein
MQGMHPSAVAAFERAIDLGSEEAHLNLGALFLKGGDYRKGWAHFGSVTPTRRANPAFRALPMWDGTSAPTQRLLIWHEQGIGDTIQMVRFIGRARLLVREITLACTPETMELFRTVAGVDNVVDMNVPGPLESFDTWLPTIQLPLIFDITEQTIPSAPYLRSDPVRIERYRPRLASPGRLRVGLVWSGNPDNSRDDERSCGLRELEPLNDVPGITWFALQQGTARADQPANAMALVPINAEVSDFADTAAIVAQLDLVITVDTSVAHLAGALGRPAWVLLGRHSDWRWQVAGDVSPWYPTLRLFRRSSDGPWSTVVAAVASALSELSTARAKRAT